jgi:hypothetical protein
LQFRSRSFAAEVKSKTDLSFLVGLAQMTVATRTTALKDRNGNLFFNMGFGKADPVRTEISNHRPQRKKIRTTFG